MLVQVAIALLALMAFIVFVVDYGMIWVARGQAQNAADAGALSGAASWAWDDPTAPPPVGGTVDLAARVVAERNLVWNEPGGVVTVFEPCPPGIPGQRCVRVNVFRNGEAGSNRLDVLFGSLLSATRHGVRATATAQVRAANATDCLKPFAILDKEPDGYSLEDDYGTELVIKEEAWPGDAGYYGYVDVGQGMGASDNWDATRRCLGTVYGIGDVLPQQPGTIASISQGFDPPNGLLALDPDAWWDPESKTIKDSCVENGSCLKFDENGNKVPDPDALVSPRVMPLAVADRDVWLKTKIVQIRIFLGFFVTSVTSPPAPKAIHGILVSRPGLLSGSHGTPDADDEFTRVIVLVR
jgi:hypothetical protein